MKKILLSCVFALLIAGSVTACSNRDENTVGGAALGGVAGNLLTGGSAAGTVVGAVGGGFVGRSMSH